MTLCVYCEHCYVWPRTRERERRGHQQCGLTMVTTGGTEEGHQLPRGRAWSHGPHHRMRGDQAVKKRAKHHCIEIQIRSGAVVSWCDGHRGDLNLNSVPSLGPECRCGNGNDTCDMLTPALALDNDQPWLSENQIRLFESPRKCSSGYKTGLLTSECLNMWGDRRGHMHLSWHVEIRSRLFQLMILWSLRRVFT